VRFLLDEGRSNSGARNYFGNHWCAEHKINIESLGNLDDF
jgi:hypothetical protein